MSPPVASFQHAKPWELFDVDMEYHVRLTNRALRDLENIYDYIQAESSITAHAWFNNPYRRYSAWSTFRIGAWQVQGDEAFATCCSERSPTHVKLSIWSTRGRI